MLSLYAVLHVKGKAGNIIIMSDAVLESQTIISLCNFSACGKDGQE